MLCSTYCIYLFIYYREERAELQHNICAFYEDIKSEMTSLEEKLCKLKKDFEEALSNDEYDLAAEINDQIEETNTKKFELECSRPKLLDKKVLLVIIFSVSPECS